MLLPSKPGRGVGRDRDQGERFYDWALIDDHADTAGVGVDRRNRNSGESDFFRCYVGRCPVPSAAVAGRRWRVESPPRARTWPVGRAPGPDVSLGTGGVCRDGGLCLPGRVPVAGTDLHRSFRLWWLCRATRSCVCCMRCSESSSLEHALGWSVFRRVHQTRAQRFHYRRQAVLKS